MFLFRLSLNIQSTLLSISYQFRIWNLDWECSVYLRNIFDKTYMAFTEPDPDGNSHQPGPGREIFGNLKIRL